MPIMGSQDSTIKAHQNGCYEGAKKKKAHQKFSLIFECLYTFLINFYPTEPGRAQPETLLSDEQKPQNRHVRSLERQFQASGISLLLDRSDQCALHPGDGATAEADRHGYTALADHHDSA